LLKSQQTGALDRQSAAPFGLASCRQVTQVVRGRGMKL